MHPRITLPLSSTVVSLALLLPFGLPAMAACAATDTESGPVGHTQTATTATNPTVSSVLLISVDGLSPAAVATLGRQRTPALHRLMARGTSTRNARTAVELTTTLPNHTGMVTGRRIDEKLGGHGVWWNDDRLKPATVHRAAGHRVESVFTSIDDAGGSAAVFAGKTKFTLWNRSWGGAIDRFQVRAKDGRLAQDVRTDLKQKNRSLRFWHIAAPDRAGHANGFGSKQYLAAVRRVDVLIGDVLRTIRSTPKLRGKVTVVLTSDHGGGRGTQHSDEGKLANQRILFIAQGPGIPAGTDLYAINPDTVANPGRTQPAYDADLPPVRNGDAGNLVLDLLGLDPVPGSEFNADQHLSLVRPPS